MKNYPERRARAVKIRFERGGVLLEYELKPMKEGCFRALCALAGVVASSVWLRLLQPCAGSLG